MTDTKFEHTNILKRDRFQAKVNAARRCTKNKNYKNGVSLQTWLLVFNAMYKIKRVKIHEQQCEV